MKWIAVLSKSMFLVPADPSPFSLGFLLRIIHTGVHGTRPSIVNKKLLRLTAKLRITWNFVWALANISKHQGDTVP